MHTYKTLGVVRLYSKRNAGHGKEPYMLELTITSPYFIVDFNVQLFTSTTVQSERGGVGKASPIGWAHLRLSADSQNRFCYAK